MDLEISDFCNIQEMKGAPGWLHWKVRRRLLLNWMEVTA